MNIFYLLASAAQQGSGAQAGKGSSVSMLVLMGALFAVMYFVMIRPQKKKQQEEQNMRDNIQVGDEVTTIGGIMGRVVTVKEDSLVIETGADRNKMKIARWAISQKKLEDAAEESKAKRKKSKKNKDDTFDN